MRKLFTIVTILAVAVLIAPLAFAQSSGNFAAEVNTTACALDNANGNLSGGIPVVSWETDIKVPNGEGTALYIIPSFVSGILTKTKLSTGDLTSSAYAGVEVCVDLDQGWVNGYTVPYCVIYDKRFQQLNSNLFTTLLQDCDPAQAGIQPCELELVLSTLSAHSFNFVAYDIPGGTRTVSVDVNFIDSDGAGGNAAACVGPGVVTVTQGKVFSTSDGIDLTP